MGDLVLLVLFYVINSPKYILRDFKAQIKKYLWTFCYMEYHGTMLFYYFNHIIKWYLFDYIHGEPMQYAH